MKYRVVFTQTAVNEIEVEAESVDEAKKKYEDIGLYAELFFIEDENGCQVIYN